MIVLGIDTSGYVNAVGVVDGNRIMADNIFPAKTDSLEQIVPNIDDTLKSLGLTLREVQGIGVGLGPGSWTGIRVGVTVGKILAFSANRPVCGVPTLEALAFSARLEAPLICPVISVGVGDAVYAGLYRPINDTVARIGDYHIGDVKSLSPLITGPAVIVGLGVMSYTRLIEQESGKRLKAIEALPSGAAVASLAAIRLARGESDNALSLTPLYLKESTAKVFVNKYFGKDVPLS
jgi:tRNA threonylcarbamoyladenosine biosynthesis protein TsaB